MNCTEAELHLSALYDGEPVPYEVADHAAHCQHCRAVLNNYSRMGAELRLAAALESKPLPPLKRPSRRPLLDVLWTRIAIPRFAFATLLAALVLLPIGVSLMRAQSRPLWFQFGYTLQPNSEAFHYIIAQNGYDDTDGTLAYVNGAPVAATMRIRIERISDDDVLLRARAVPADLVPHGSGFALGGPGKPRISLDHTPALHYKPGDTLPVAIEGGGTLYLKGEVFDRQPKLAFGSPLEAPAGKLIVRSPVLTGAKQYIAEMDGATALTSKPEQAIQFRAGVNGTFLFSLREFPGAVQGKAEWGELTFKLDGEQYRLVAAAPITGGDQPVPVWVRHDPPSGEGVALGAGPIPQ